MNIKNIFLYLLYGLLLFGIVGSGFLVADEFTQGNICPKLLSLPACYIILACFIGLLVIHIQNFSNKYFYILAAIPISIALYGSIFQILGSIECPKTESGIPMCFISLGIFSSITLCKYLSSYKK